ncbi:hypothetical protein Mapa_001288 [Marchantia paleacea]|nr:hypothetical protein Mapa_001288 [Marchantia paleacea]
MLRISKTLSQADRMVYFEKKPGWRGVTNPGYVIRSMAAEWYVTFAVGTPRENGRQQRAAVFGHRLLLYTVPVQNLPCQCGPPKNASLRSPCSINRNRPPTET